MRYGRDSNSLSGRILRFTMQLRALNGARLPLGGLIASHVVESLALIPIMIGHVPQPT